MPPLSSPWYLLDKIEKKHFNGILGRLLGTLFCETIYALSRI